jgi:hypothetical protein
MRTRCGTLACGAHGGARFKKCRSIFWRTFVLTGTSQTLKVCSALFGQNSARRKSRHRPVRRTARAEASAFAEPSRLG